MTDSPTADALRELTDRCLPNKTWCTEGARLRDEADDARDRWLAAYAGKGYLGDLSTHVALWDALNALRDHVGDCSSKVTS